MYEPVYSTYCGEVGIQNRSLAVSIEPCFGTTITKYKPDKIYWLNDNQILKEEKIEEKEIMISRETQWLLKVKSQDFFWVVVTERTRNVQTPFGAEMNWIINQKVKEAQKEYQKRKETEKRLYFYDARNNRLRLYNDGRSFHEDWYQYELNTLFSSYQVIDRRYPVPENSCFLLGKIRRTIGVEDCKRRDFIEPIAKFDWNDEEDTLFGNGENWLGNRIFRVLQFSIRKKEPTGLIATKVQNKMGCNMQEFLKMLNTALEAGDIGKINKFYDFLKKWI